MVAAEFRDVHVSVPVGACDKAEGVQEAVFHPVTEEQSVGPFFFDRGYEG